MSPTNIPLEIQSISTSFSNLNGYSVVLKEIGGNRKLQIIVGATEAQALAVSMEKIITSRPLTHHFIQVLLNEFEITLKYVQIYKYEEGVYYAHVALEDNFGHIKYIDCRPSDALSLALKMDKPIFAVEEIFDDVTQKFHNLVEVKQQKPAKAENLPQIETSRLKKMLKEAIDNEDYEQAEKIQSELNKR
jgi:uncharacterized protein